VLSDFHLHTIVSDGDLDPAELLGQAARRGVAHLSITDHDTLGSYRWRGGHVFREAARLGLDLTIGIEMDADLDALEVHLLGFEISLDDTLLADHLERVRAARFERARREVGLVNELLGKGAITEAEVFVPGRETLMKPHFIHPILAKGFFSTYEEANRWYRKNVKTGVDVPKPSLAEAIRLIHGAGGWACLAHPGYYQREGVSVASRLGALRALGLDGIELDYPYHACSPHEFTLTQQETFLGELKASAKPLGYRFTRGSDCHTVSDFDRVYGPLQGPMET